MPAKCESCERLRVCVRFVIHDDDDHDSMVRFVICEDCLP